MDTPSQKTRALVLRALGVVTLIAFVSIWVQIDGLIGSNGILPFRAHLDSVAANSDGNPFWDAPTLFWWWPTDTALHVVCGTGCVLSVLLISGLPIEGPLLLALWALYLSLGHVGQTFLGFQWDTLLTETLFVACLLGRWHPRACREPSWMGLFALRVLLFKLMLGSGAVKLASGDPTWTDGTALSFHYWTQPIPNPVSWTAHHLPLWWHQLETWATLFIELVLPFAIFAGKPGRAVAFVGFTLVLGLLFVTGNYGFFQLLSMVLVLALLQDSWLTRLPTLEFGWPTKKPTDRVRWARELAQLAVVLPFIYVGFAMQYGRTYAYGDLHPTVLEHVRKVYRYRTVNAYGLFANMTERRPEVHIEGSDDGKTWTRYTFRYKPGPLDRAPPIIGPHMPRVDWQMWFAALRNCKKSWWVDNLMVRLQEAEPAVVALLADNPFPDGPRYIRAVRSQYTFTDSGDDWWEETGVRPYCAVKEKPRILRAPGE